MSAEIINLRQARKRRARDRKAAEAAESRARFGRSKTARAVEEMSRARAEQALDGHLRAGLNASVTPDGQGETGASRLDDASQSPCTPPKPSQ